MPQYHSKENNLNELIGEAIINQLPSLILPKQTAYHDLRKIIRAFMRSHPEIFWFSHQYRFDESSSTLYLNYNFSQAKRDFFAKQIDNAVHTLFHPERLVNLSDAKKVACVYKWIAHNTTYNVYSSFNQTIYSVLINRNSVCTGYAKTAQYLLGLIGVESHLVFGKFYADQSANGRHAWNIVKIDGVWYHVDFSLADPSLKYLLNADEVPVEFDGLLWNYFCKPTDYILRNRTIEDFDSYPQCIESIDQLFKVVLPTIQKGFAVCKSNSGTTAAIYLNPHDKNSVLKVARHDQELVVNEAMMLQRLKGCNHIVDLKSSFDGGLILEQLTPWNELLGSHYYHLNEGQLKEILTQLAQGLIECRDKGISYSDIHYNNVLVSKEGIYKWGDFGMAFSSTPGGSLPPQMIGPDGIAYGSRWFMAPETFADRIFTESSAIYSLSILAYFVMNGMLPPFLSENVSEDEALAKLHSHTAIPLPAEESNYGLLAHLICHILNADVHNRMKSFEDFIEFINSEIIIPGENVSSAAVSTKPIGAPLKKSDPDLYASTAWPCTAESAYVVRSTIDPDLFASTCGFPLESPTTYSPSKINIKRHENSSVRDDANDECQVQEVNTCVYAPAEVQLKKSFIIRVYIYLPDEQDEVDTKVHHTDPLAVKKDYRPLDLPIKQGDRISVQLSLSEGVECKVSMKSVIWRNRYTDCSFIAKLIDSELENIEGCAYVFVNDIPAGEMIFTIDVVDNQPDGRYTKVETHRFSKIFISYAHQDADKVKGIAEGCRMLGADYFFDTHTLHAGDIFPEIILRYIEQADLFVLCWSKNAAKSEWVQRERQHALRLIHEEKSSLCIYPLCLRPTAPLPTDMSDKYHFGVL